MNTLTTKFYKSLYMPALGRNFAGHKKNLFINQFVGQGLKIGLDKQRNLRTIRRPKNTRLSCTYA